MDQIPPVSPGPDLVDHGRIYSQISLDGVYIDWRDYFALRDITDLPRASRESKLDPVKATALSLRGFLRRDGDGFESTRLLLIALPHVEVALRRQDGRA